MPDVTVTTKRAIELKAGFDLIEALTPPPAPRGRYALAKWSEKVNAAVELYQKQLKQQLEDHSHKDERGKAIRKDIGGGRVKYALIDEDAFTAASDALQEEEVTLTGVRPVTQAELGDCPVPVLALRLLLGTVIEDKEPAAA
ncbi:MAG: hypothetical protein WD825_17425 [Gemmatimonadaceae bacterium]